MNVPQWYADVLGAQRRSGECWVTVTAVVDCGEIPERILSYRDDDENKMFFSIGLKIPFIIAILRKIDKHQKLLKIA